MAGRPVAAPHAVCEKCWLEDHTRWEPESIDQTGNILMRLTGVDVPQKLNTGTVEVCSLCGCITVSGIYEYIDPKAVFYADEDEMEEEFIFNLDDSDDDFF